MAFMRPKLIPVLFTIPALIMMLGLGTWQVQRMAWKGDMIERLQTRVKLAPVSLASLEAKGKVDEVADEFTPVKITGQFNHAGEVHLVNRSLNGNPGVHVLTPLKRSDNGKVILIDRGWVPFERRDVKNRLEGQVAGDVSVTGLIRFPKPQSSFMPENVPSKGQWYSMDPITMAKQSGADVPVYYILSSDKDTPGGFPIGRQWTVDIPNNHLEYAITWYSLALILFVVFVVYHRKPEDGQDS